MRDKIEHSVPGDAGQINIIEKKGTNFLLHPDWGGNFSGEKLALKTYLSTFQPEDDVCLLIWLPPEDRVSTREAVSRLAETIKGLGFDPDWTPDILLVDSVGLTQRDKLLEEVQAVVETSATSGHSTLSEARTKGLPVISTHSDFLAALTHRTLELSAVVRAAPHVMELAIPGHSKYPQRNQLLAEFIRGYAHFLETKETPQSAYVAMREWFCLSDGKFNDLMKEHYAEVYPPQPLPSATGILGNMRGAQLAEVSEALRNDGFYIFPNRLDAEICDRLLDFALRTEAILHSAPPGITERQVYDPKSPLVAKYRIPSESLLGQEDVQRLMADPSIFAVVQDYLGCYPVLDLLTMWWSTAVWKDADSEAAQLFHFDMDRTNFLKFFVYLTDVTEETGPHSYVRGSHQGLPPAMRRDGRFSDQLIAQYYASEDVIQITAPRGTVFIADTRGIHKGVHLQSGHRLIFQMEFASSLFGAPYEEIRSNERLTPELAQAMQRYPRTFGLLHRPKPTT